VNLLTSLRHLVALSEHRHFARAAQACHITQPALSNALRALEKEFGTPIVKRPPSYAGLTPEGEQVLGAARRMLHEHALLQQELASSAEKPKGRLQLGAVRSQGELEALPLVAPEMATPVAFINLARARASRALEAVRHSGSLRLAAS